MWYINIPCNEKIKNTFLACSTLKQSLPKRKDELSFLKVKLMVVKENVSPGLCDQEGKTGFLMVFFCVYCWIIFMYSQSEVSRLGCVYDLVVLKTFLCHLPMGFILIIVLIIVVDSTAALLAKEPAARLQSQV
jgi:hypothetical protein